MSQTIESTQEELGRRRRSAVTIILALLALTLLLMVLAYTGVLIPEAGRIEPVLDMALRISIVFFGVGAVVLRRTKFNAARLEDIASLRGPSGLLETLQKTTVLVALIGGGIAVMGFVINVLRGSVEGEVPQAVWIGMIAIAVLLYAYPRRAAWERVVEMTRPGRAAVTPPSKGTTL